MLCALSAMCFNRPGMKRKYWVLFIFFFGVLVLDQWTKSMIVQKLPLHQRVDVIHGFFSIIHVRNTGGAFGILGGKGEDSALCSL